MHSTEAVQAARRALEICNACRYCRGYCAVFSAMELRRSFSNADVGYLANLCHNCGNCHRACQYAPPHEFGVNIPKCFSHVRAETYEYYAWPKLFGRLFGRNGIVIASGVALVTTIVFALAMVLQSPEVGFEARAGSGAFYNVIPQAVMAMLAGATFGFSVIAATMSLSAFWRDIGEGIAKAGLSRPLWVAVRDLLTLRNLSGGGAGCNERIESYSSWRRNFHHGVFYGFLSCCMSTTVAAVYDHLFDWPPPYPLFSIPVQLGVSGGMAMIIGATGLLVNKIRADHEVIAENQFASEYLFIVHLLIIAGSGIALLALRETPVMKPLLAFHFSAVLWFFLLLPNSKFVHGIYRAAALLRAAMEMRSAATK